MRLDASAFVRSARKLSGSSHSSESVLRYEAAPVIGSSPETQSSASFSVFELAQGRF